MGNPGVALSQVPVPLPPLDSQVSDGPRYGWLLTHARVMAWGVLALAAAYIGAAISMADTWSITALAGCTMLGVGVVACGAAAHRRALEEAVSSERRRIARDLHDGLAQELAYIRMETLRLVARDSDDRITHIGVAAERALAESRGVIAALQADDRPFQAQLSRVAKELTERGGARLTLDLGPSVDIDAKRREALLRIVREAITNGVRHGRATDVALRLSVGDGLRMAVQDNGAGFVPGGPRRRGGFGLTTMRERAEALGGDLTVSSNPGEGTLVEVLLP